MRRKDRLVTDRALLNDVIRRAMVMRLAMVDGQSPYVIPLSFGYDDHHIYFHSALHGRKVDILQKNNRVCLEFEADVALIKADRPCKWSFSFFSVIAFGRAERVADPQGKRRGLNEIHRHLDPQQPPYDYSEAELSSVLVYRITIEEMAGKAKDQPPGA